MPEEKRKKIYIEKNGAIYKITSIYLLKDGSFKIEAPYCPFTEGHVVKFSPKYGQRFYKIENHELKQKFGLSRRPHLSVHASGFVQFSGSGIKSGIDRNTRLAKGIGVYSQPLITPVTSGPTSIIQIWGLEHFTEVDEFKNEDLLIRYNHFYGQIGASGKKSIEDVDFNSYALHIFVFSSSFQDKIFSEQGHEKMTFDIPQYHDGDTQGATFTFPIIRLRSIGSFLGIIPFKNHTKFTEATPFGFTMGGPAGSDLPSPLALTIYSIEDFEKLKKAYERSIISLTSFNYNKSNLENLDYK